MNGTTLLTTITLAVGVGGLLGGFVVSLRKGNKGQQSELIALQQSEIAALTGSNQRLEKDKAALLAENDALKRSNTDLKEIAQQTPDIKKLIREIANLNKTVGKLVMSE